MTPVPLLWGLAPQCHGLAATSFLRGLGFGSFSHRPRLGNHPSIYEPLKAESLLLLVFQPGDNALSAPGSLCPWGALPILLHLVVSAWVCWLDHIHRVELVRVTKVFASRAKATSISFESPHSEWGHPILLGVLPPQVALNLLPLTRALEVRYWLGPTVRNKYYSATHFIRSCINHLYCISPNFGCHWLWDPP